LGIINSGTIIKRKYIEIIKKIIKKMVNNDTLKNEYNLRVIITTINYILIMVRTSGLWEEKGRKAEAEFFNSFEKFVTEELAEEDNTFEIISNFHEMLLHIKEKYSLQLHEDKNQDTKFYKTLLLMHRYPVNTSDIGEVFDFVSGNSKQISLQQHLKKSGNIVIQSRKPDGQIVYIFTTRSIMLNLLKNEDTTFYACKEIPSDPPAQPHSTNIYKSIKYIANTNFYPQVGKQFWDISIITDFPDHQIFILQNLEESFPTYSTVSSVTKLRSAVGGWHCNVPAASGTSKLLLGISDTTTKPLSRSASLTTPDISPISVDSENFREGDEVPEHANNTTRRSTRGTPIEPAPVPVPGFGGPFKPLRTPFWLSTGTDR
jgi:hypothetical protein